MRSYLFALACLFLSACSGLPSNVREIPVEKVSITEASQNPRPLQRHLSPLGRIDYRSRYSGKLHSRAGIVLSNQLLRSSGTHQAQRRTLRCENF